MQETLVLTPTQAHQDSPVRVLNENGRGGVLLVCEHASRHIPARYKELGIDPQWRESHAVWDPGALEVAKQLSEGLDAPVVYGCLSRLVYDCNRAPNSESAIVERSEMVEVPGNKCLSGDQREERINSVYRPFRARVEQMLARVPMALITIHSFTSVYHGKKRDTEIGILHDQDSRLADTLLEYASSATHRLVERNKPYGPQDDVMHSLRTYGVSNNLPNAMIEVRSDLISDIDGVKAISTELLAMIKLGLDSLSDSHDERRHA